jgi:hypothetical protein
VTTPDTEESLSLQMTTLPKVALAVIGALVALGILYFVPRPGNLRGGQPTEAAGGARSHGPAVTPSASEHAVIVHLKLSAPRPKDPKVRRESVPL